MHEQCESFMSLSLLLTNSLLFQNKTKVCRILHSRKRVYQMDFVRLVPVAA
jgi:hypothetical protein